MLLLKICQNLTNLRAFWASFNQAANSSKTKIRTVSDGLICEIKTGNGVRAVLRVHLANCGLFFFRLAFMDIPWKRQITETHILLVPIKNSDMKKRQTLWSASL
jgi:hypothetical protein